MYEVGKPVLIQEALGYFIGTLIEETPFHVILGADCVWVRDMGTMDGAVTSGRVNECHRMPHRKIKDHAIRHIGPWSHKVPKP
jgi:hypothetical protein